MTPVSRSVTGHPALLYQLGHTLRWQLISRGDEPPPLPSPLPYPLQFSSPRRPSFLMSSCNTSLSHSPCHSFNTPSGQTPNSTGVFLPPVKRCGSCGETRWHVGVREPFKALSPGSVWKKKKKGWHSQAGTLRCRVSVSMLKWSSRLTLPDSECVCTKTLKPSTKENSCIASPLTVIFWAFILVTFIHILN